MPKTCSFESWKKKISSKYGCDKDAQDSGNYCQKHGCIYCSYRNEGKWTSAIDGESLVCKSHKKRDQEKLIENNAELSKLENEDKKLEICF